MNNSNIVDSILIEECLIEGIDPRDISVILDIPLAYVYAVQEIDFMQDYMV